jgi:hypothetical protein
MDLKGEAYNPDTINSVAAAAAAGERASVVLRLPAGRF